MKLRKQKKRPQGETDGAMLAMFDRLAKLTEAELLQACDNSQNVGTTYRYAATILTTLLSASDKRQSIPILAKRTFSSAYFRRVMHCYYLLASGQLNELIDQVVALKKHHPNDRLSLLFLAEAQYASGQATEAFYNWSNVVPGFVFNTDIIIKSRCCLEQITATTYSEGLVSGAIAYLHDERFDSAQIAPLVASLLTHNYQLADSGQKHRTYDLADLCSDMLLQDSLRRIILPHPGLERLIIAIRKSVVEAIIQIGEVPSIVNSLLCSLAQQAFINEYVYFIDHDEEVLINTLKGTVRDLVDGSPPQSSLASVAGLIIVIALYEPLIDQPFAANLLTHHIDEWPEDIRQTIDCILYQPEQEKRLRSSIRQLGHISNPVSLTVQAQYEEHPYPRWIDINKRRLGKNYLAHYRMDRFPFIAPPFLDEPHTMLVAGCGTGKQPLSRALAFPEMRIVAIDLSCSSLCYAKRMAQRFNVKNIEFFQGDILSLSGIEERFHIIECVGVLHHMERPEQGLAVLRDLLVPNGIMRIGLYSRKAREHITAFRERNTLLPTIAAIRQFRQAVLTGQATGLNDLLDSPDFYSTSMCRDLLFHAREHCFTIPEIAELLAKNKLEFKGFSHRYKATFTQFQTLHPGKKDLFDLDKWHQFELHHPRTFAGMYQFFVQGV